MARKVYWFNPTCEMEVANGTVSYMPPKHLRLMRESLSVLPLVFADADDVVLVHQEPDVDFVERLSRAGFDLPRFVLLSKASTVEASFAPTPWGLSPAAAKVLQPFGAKWNPQLTPFFDRRFSLQILNDLVNQSLPHLICEDEIAVVGDTIEDVITHLTVWQGGVIKAPLSSSGRGVQILHRPDVNPSVHAKTQSVLKQQGVVMLEPLLDKVCDFAYEFEIRNGEINFVAYSYFRVSPTGQYECHYLPFDVSVLPEEAQALWGNGSVERARIALMEALGNSELPKCYDGYLGVDAMVYRKKDGSVSLQPCLEINLRYNMGIVAWALESHIAPGSRCQFHIGSRSLEDLVAFDKHQQFENPPVVEGELIRSGYLPLTPPTNNVQNMAYIIVED